jgi:hypothetical protein
LPPPHVTFDEWKARKQNHVTPALSFAELAKRAKARKEAEDKKPPKPTPKPILRPDQAARMLSLASSAIRDEIIRKLSQEDALEVAEKITDPELRDALVKRALDFCCPS